MFFRNFRFFIKLLGVTGLFAICFLLVCSLTCFLAVKVEVICSFETSGVFRNTKNRETLLFIVTGGRTPNPARVLGALVFMFGTFLSGGRSRTIFLLYPMYTGSSLPL
jgi:hypothetical protein